MSLQLLKLDPSVHLASDRMVHWCSDKALPMWAVAGRNSAGGFFEHLLPDGSPDINANTRVRVNTRQIYAYSHAAAMGWFADALTVAQQTNGFVHKHCLGKDASGTQLPVVGLLLDSRHNITDDRIDLYTQAFSLLAAAWLYRVSGQKETLQWARDIIRFMNENMASPHGGWIESLPESGRPRRQNPHMHLFEAFMALYESTGDAQFLELADHVYDLFKTRFLDERTHLLHEFFTDDWSLHPEKGDRIEPGHMMEWCWLLSKYAGIKRINLYTEIEAIYDQAMKLGINPKTGLLWDEMQASGTVTKATHRSWSLTEYLKASIAMASYGNVDAEKRIPALVDMIFDYYLNQPVKGGWIDCLNSDGEAISTTMPASTFYHYICASVELDTYATRNLRPEGTGKLQRAEYLKDCL